MFLFLLLVLRACFRFYFKKRCGFIFRFSILKSIQMESAVRRGRIIQLQVFRYTNHHSACIFYNVHAIRLKYRDKHKRICAFKYADALADGITK
jgi:hypothetical protein